MNIGQAFLLFLVLPMPAFGGDFERGIEALERKDYSLAITCFDACIRENPKEAKAYSCRGFAYLNKKDFDKAIADCSMAIRIEPRDADAYFSRGDAYTEKKEYDRAIADYSQVIRIEPRHVYACNALAWTMATCPKDSVRDGNKAIVHATKACELSQWKDASILDTLAAANAESGNFTEAVKWEKMAIELAIDKKQAEKARQRLKLYEEGKPYRDHGK